jgi:hypothetical protein
MRQLGALLGLAILAACSGHGHAAPTPAPAKSAAALLIDDRGITMPLEQAVTHIGFRPYLPSPQVVAYAVIPPLGDLDTTEHRGIAIEYVAGRTPMLLSEWPKQNFTISFGKNASIAQTCTPVHYKQDGVAWSTQRNLVMTLQPDGYASTSQIDAETTRLLRTGACR